MSYTPSLYARALLEIYREKGLGKALVGRFFEIVRRNNHVSQLPEILRRFEDLLYQSEGITRVDVEMARKSLESLVPKLRHAFGKKSEIRTSLNPGLLAGVRITVDGKTAIDASLARQLERIFSAESR